MTESNPTITIQIWRQKTSRNCWLSKSVFTFSKQGGEGGRVMGDLEVNYVN